MAFEKTREKCLLYLLQELATDCEAFCGFMRMPYPKFTQLADLLSESIKKQDTPMRTAIHPRERLALQVRFVF